MARTIHLIRHGDHDLLGRMLCGRMAGVALNEFGREQMAACARRLSPPPTALQSSPRLRTLQSAAIVGQTLNLPVEVAAAMDEIDVGDWTSSSFTQLDGDPRWRRWNSQRGSSAPPNGESMRALQDRVMNYLTKLAQGCCDEIVAIVSHAEPIRAALLHCAGIPLDDFMSIDVAPASISTLTWGREGLCISELKQKEPA